MKKQKKNEAKRTRLKSTSSQNEKGGRKRDKRKHKKKTEYRKNIRRAWKNSKERRRKCKKQVHIGETATNYQW
jgi:hypothetical protein